MVVNSYSPNGFIEDPEAHGANCCCGLAHIRTGARILSILHFLALVLGIAFNFYANGIGGIVVIISAMSLVLYAAAVVIGVFGEKRFFLLPFLLMQGIITVLLTVLATAYGIIGAATDSLTRAHKNVTAIRELYRVHHLDPEDEQTQTIISCGMLVALVLSATISAYCWFVIYDVYKYFKRKDSTLGPERGYQRGKIVADTLKQDY